MLLTLGLMGMIKPFGFGSAEILPMILVLNLSTFILLLFMIKGMRITRLGGVVLMSTYFGMVLSVVLLVVL
jgi:Ca2+/Na+ antiporter